MTSNPADILLASNRWATRNIIEACTQLSPEQFQQSFEIGPGALQATLTHILGAMRGWGDLLAGREQRARLETEGPFTAEQLLSLLDDLADDLERSVRSHPADELVTGSRGEKEYTFTRGGVLTHVTTHGMHHRAQCLNMLRHLGVDPLPASSVVEWILTADAQA